MKTKNITLGKYLAVAFLSLGVVFTSCNKDIEEEDPNGAINSVAHAKLHIPIVYKSTGETCFYCGDWGWQAWIDLADNLHGKAFTFANYSTGFSNGNFRGEEIDQTLSSMEFMKQNFNPGGNGKPNFFVNGVNHNTSASAAETDALAKHADVSNVEASASIEGTLVDGVLSVTAEAKFSFL